MDGAFPLALGSLSRKLQDKERLKAKVWNWKSRGSLGKLTLHVKLHSI